MPAFDRQVRWDHPTHPRMVGLRGIYGPPLVPGRISSDIRLKGQMGKGRDKRRRNAKRKDEVHKAKAEPSGGETFGPIDPYAPVLSPLKPKPSMRFGAIASPSAG